VTEGPISLGGKRNGTANLGVAWLSWSWSPARRWMRWNRTFSTF